MHFGKGRKTDIEIKFNRYPKKRYLHYFDITIYFKSVVRDLRPTLYKGKGDSKEYTSYRSLNLLEHAMKVVERVFEKIRKTVEISKIQMGFMLGKRTVDAISAVTLLTGKYEKLERNCVLNLFNKQNEYTEQYFTKHIEINTTKLT